MVEVVVLGVNGADKRIALGLKQALGDPWEEALKKYPVGAQVEAPVTSLAKFGAFVDLGDGIEGMIHIGDISHEKRLNHPSDELKVGEVVKAQVLEADQRAAAAAAGDQATGADLDRRIHCRAQGRGQRQRAGGGRFGYARQGRTGRRRDGQLQAGRDARAPRRLQVLQKRTFLRFRRCWRRSGSRDPACLRAPAR